MRCFGCVATAQSIVQWVTMMQLNSAGGCTRLSYSDMNAHLQADLSDFVRLHNEIVTNYPILTQAQVRCSLM